MNPPKPGMTISSFQMGAMVLGVMLSLGPLFIGRIAVEHAARDAWMMTILAGLLVLVNIWLMVRLAARFPDMTFSGYSRLLLGNWFGSLLTMLFIILGLLSCAVTLWYTGHLLNTYVLINTPSWIIGLLLLLLNVYVSFAELRVLGRVVVIIFFLSMPFNYFFVPPFLNHGDALNLRPFFENGWSVLPLGIFGVLFAFAGYEVLQTFYPYVRDKSRVMMHALWSIGLVSLLFVLAVLTQQIVYPLEYLQKIWAPSVQYVALVSIPVLERTDMIFILFWFFVLFKTTTIYFYRAVIEMEQLFGLRKKQWLIVSFAVISFLLSIAPVNVMQMERVLVTVFTTSVCLSFGLTPLLYMMAWYRQRRWRRAQ